MTRDYFSRVGWLFWGGEFFDSRMLESWHNQTKGGDTMKKYICIVRDYNYICPSDNYLKALDMYFISPIIELNFEKSLDKAVDTFDEQFKKYFSHFLNPHYEFIPQ